MVSEHWILSERVEQIPAGRVNQEPRVGEPSLFQSGLLVSSLEFSRISWNQEAPLPQRKGIISWHMICEPQYPRWKKGTDKGLQ